MNYRILIVDDSPLLRAVGRRAALQAGFAADNVREAQDGKQALEALAAASADAVLLDLQMPVMDGVQFLEAKAKLPGLDGVRVALVTTDGNSKRLARMTELGVTHYLQKPFRAAELRALMHELFASDPEPV